MALFGLINKQKRKEFYEMSKDEKRLFLANDLIERMVRIEQKLRASFGEGALPYYQTQYYKDLREDEKKRFKKYIESKDKKRKWKIFSFMGLCGFGLFAFSRITGNAIASGGEISILDAVMVSLFILILGILGVHTFLERNRWKRMERHFNVLEDILVRRKASRK